MLFLEVKFSTGPSYKQDGLGSAEPVELIGV